MIAMYAEIVTFFCLAVYVLVSLLFGELFE
jgi:hypothetical protein